MQPEARAHNRSWQFTPDHAGERAQTPTVYPLIRLPGPTYYTRFCENFGRLFGMTSAALASIKSLDGAQQIGPIDEKSLSALATTHREMRHGPGKALAGCRTAMGTSDRNRLGIGHRDGTSPAPVDPSRFVQRDGPYIRLCLSRIQTCSTFSVKQRASFLRTHDAQRAQRRYTKSPLRPGTPA